MLDLLFACFSFIVQFFALFCLFLFFFCFIKVVLYVCLCVFLFYLLAVLGFILLSFFFFFLVNDDIMPITYTYEYIRVCERVCGCVYLCYCCVLKHCSSFTSEGLNAQCLLCFFSAASSFPRMRK